MRLSFIGNFARARGRESLEPPKLPTLPFCPHVGLAPSESGRTPEVVPRDFELLEPGSIPVGAIAETGTASGWGACSKYFCQRIQHVSLLVLLLVSTTIDEKIYRKFIALWH